MIIHSKETVHILNNSKLFGTILSTALPSKLNKFNNTGTQMQETFIIWNIFFFNFIYNFHTRLGKGKVFKAFWEFEGGLLAQI